MTSSCSTAQLISKFFHFLTSRRHNQRCSQDPVTSVVKPAISPMTVNKPSVCVTTVVKPATSRPLVLSQRPPTPSNATLVAMLAMSKVTAHTVLKVLNVTTVLSLATFLVLVLRTKVLPQLLNPESQDLAPTRAHLVTSVAVLTTLPRTVKLAL